MLFLFVTFFELAISGNGSSLGSRKKVYSTEGLLSELHFLLFVLYTKVSKKLIRLCQSNPWLASYSFCMIVNSAKCALHHVGTLTGRQQYF